MPKIKTHRGAAKRLRKTATGKVKRNKAYAGHMMTCKNAKRKKKLRQGCMVSSANIDAVKKMLPY
ncbi:MAG: 50S ribosomal protein L35 [Nitrospirae bacterium]|nr:50S ribosomal protein L35 [Nitrospirota bacterium]